MDHYDDHFFKEIQGLSTFVSPPQDQQTNYYNQYCRLYLANFVLTSQIKQIIKEKNNLEQKLHKLEAPFCSEDKLYDNQNSDMQDKNKRHRRTANQISRFHRCTVPTCQKSYGSQGSLNQHMKLKHPQLVEQEEQQAQLPLKVKKENINQNTEKTLRTK